MGASFHQQWARGDEADQIVHFTEFSQARHIVAGAVRHGEDAVLEGRVVAADHAGADALVNTGGEEGVHAAARNAHRAEATSVELGAGLQVIDQAQAIAHADAYHRGAQVEGEHGRMGTGRRRSLAAL